MNPVSNTHKQIDHILLLIGLVLCIMELAKQFYLYFIYNQQTYNVWYLPFQLCSIPMYLCILRIFLPDKASSRLSLRRSIDALLQDYALLGGIAAILVPDGFTYPKHPFLTLHGYLWHILLITISLCIQVHYHRPHQSLSYRDGVLLFLPLACIAEGINILLHPYGDCDMFYLSPYHLSSQPVFHTIDALVGRPLGVLIYLCAIILAAGILHQLINWIWHMIPAPAPQTKKEDL